MYDLRELCGFSGRPESDCDVRAAVLGFLLPYFAQHSATAGNNLRWHIDRLDCALRQDQLYIYFDNYGRLCGHLLWTNAGQELEKQLLRFGPGVADGAQISSGPNVWVLEMTIHFGLFSWVFGKLNDRTVGVSEVTYFRYKNGKRMAKRIGLERLAARFHSDSQVRVKPFPPVFAKNDGLLHVYQTTLDAAVVAGEIFSLISEAPAYASMPLQRAILRLRAPLSQLQYRVYRTPGSDAPSGFISWALLDVAQLESHDLSPLSLQPHQWNEGRHVCVFDCVATPASWEAMCADLSTALFHAHPLTVCTAHASDQPACLTTLDSTARKRLDQIPAPELVVDITGLASLMQACIP